MEHNIFAIELCMRLEPGDRLRAQLKDLIAKHPAASTAGLKWELLTKCSDRLLENARLFEKGCWDFFDDDGRALRDYDMWSNGMITEEGARKEPSGKPGELDQQPRYMTFTAALLLKADTACARDLSRLCDIPEDRLWRRETFVRILRGLRRVSFAAVKSDVLYLIPGDDGWGLTATDLEEEKFEYLRQIA
jgi:hypothetical protein